MSDKKKMSVAEILAAARKTDSKGGGAAHKETAESETSPVSPEPVAETAAEPVAAASQPAEEAAAALAPAAAKKPLAAGERPNVKDILAMARAGKPGAAPAPKAEAPKAPGAAKPAAAKPAAEKPSAKPAAKPAAAVAVAKDTASILAAARKSVKPGPMTKAEAAAIQAKAASPAGPSKVKEKPVVPPLPPKPAYAKLSPTLAATDENRRGFFLVLFGSALAIGFTAFSATMGLWTLGFARFMFPNILTEPPSRFKVGFKENFAPGQVETKFVSLFGVWIVNGEYNGKQQIYALRTVCTHLGCTPNWLEAEQKFKCPCHGSGFYKDGINFEGPAPRPLERYSIRIGDDGQLEVDKSRLFQEELGQWTDPDSFVAV
jgi:cytochrome b6-f complex iron-sulfur subunit